MIGIRNCPSKKTRLLSYTHFTIETRKKTMVSYRKRANGWEYRISYKDVHGNYREKSKSKFKTKAEATLAANEMLLKINNEVFEDDNLTFADYFAKWVKIHKEPTISLTTLLTYQRTHKIIEEYFSDTKLNKINFTTYQEFLNYLGSKYYKETVIKKHHHIKSCLKMAVHEGLITKNFAELGKISAKKESRPIEEKFLELDEYEKLIRDLRPKTIYKTYMFIYLIAVTGMRYAECKGLTWDDIDLYNKTININKTWSDIQKDFGKTKNKQSIREIPIDNRTALLLKQYKLKHLKDKYPFTTINNRSINHLLKQLIKRQIHIHSLRHTYVSYLIANGMDATDIARLVGHKDSFTTLKVYAHQFEKLKQKNNDKAIKIISSI